MFNVELHIVKKGKVRFRVRVRVRIRIRVRIRVKVKVWVRVWVRVRLVMMSSAPPRYPSHE